MRLRYTASMTRGASKKRARKSAALRAALVAVCLLAAAALAFLLALPGAGPLREHNPETTALIEARAPSARQKGRAARHVQRWVSLSHISIWLQRAVVNSEDARFWEHSGIDTVEAQKAVESAIARGHLGRGASTLTQQLAKNLWLGEERSIFRKLKEALLARRLEDLGKARILELYLNVAEWGSGIYGAEAAAQTWFKKPAAQLLPEEAAVLAAMLPAPLKRSPRRPSGRLLARAADVLELYGTYGQLSPDELPAARERLRRLLPSPP
jgi:monofunctional biosynthetic peptidoglycan transglycosylase